MTDEIKQKLKVDSDKKHFNEEEFKKAPIKLLRKYYKKYEKCFKYKRSKPLCVGIFELLIEAENLKDKIKIYTLKRALKFYTKGIQYQYALYTNKHRYDLTGEFCGEVTEQHKNEAYQNIVKAYEKMNKETFNNICPDFKFKNDKDKT